MGSQREQSRNKSKKAAFCGMLVALGVALMLSGGLIPIATYCAPMFSAFLLLPILLEYGEKTAWTAYAATALITLVMDADKEAAFFYLFLGYYPLLKWEIERIKSKPIKLLVKLAVFNCAIVLMYLFLAIVLNMTALVSEFTEMGSILLVVFLIALNISMLLYDRLVFPFMLFYDRKIRSKLRFIMK